MKIIYEGIFKDNAHDGWGITEEYEGQFSKGKKCGWGIYHSKEKNIQGLPSIFYEGFWLNDHCSGFGSLNVQEGEIEDFLNHQK